jgi:arylsulfatase A-like enzyme
MFAAKNSLHWPRPAILGAAIVGGLCCEGASAADVAERPNILLIYCDDHAYQAISAYQQVSAYRLNLNQTPNIDRLANAGMRFDNCFVANSICGPCRAVIQTGKYSHKNGFYTNGNKFDGAQQTFPKLLQKAGYQTAVVGKWHLGEHMQPQGYDYYEYPGVHGVRRHCGVADGRMKLIHFYEPEVDQWEMYDVANDPKELNNVFGRPEYSADQARLAEELARLRRQLEVPETDPRQSRAGAAERKRPAAGQSRSAGLGRP